MRATVRVAIVVVAATVAMLAPPLAPSAGAGPGPATTIECGQDITTDVVLSHDLQCEFDENFAGVFDVVAEGVTVDLGGHTVSVDGYRHPEWKGGCALTAQEGGVFPPGCDIVLGARSVTLTNGRLVGLSVGDWRRTGVDMSRLKMERTELALSSTRLHHSVLVDSDLQTYRGGWSVDHNWLRSTPVFMTNASYGITMDIRSNIIERSPSHGIEIEMTCCYEPGDVVGEISGNWIVGSGLDGINIPGQWGEGGAVGGLGALTIADNLLVANGGDGMSLAGSLAHNRLDCPTPGVACAPQERYSWGGPVDIRNNLAFWNGGHGIHVDTPPLVIPGYGEFFPPPGLGVLDGGDNRALLNGERPQCVGVRCRWW